MSKGAPLLQKEEVLGFMVVKGVTEGVVGVDEATAGLDEDDEGDSRGTGAVIR